MHELRILENDGWTALSQGGSAALDFYGRMLDDEVTMLLPGGMALTDRDQVLQSMAGTPWDRFELTDLRVDEPTSQTGLVTYAATAARGGHEYSALVSSLYVSRPDGWRLRFHQQTPR
jgi:hypothetical protein